MQLIKITDRLSVAKQPEVRDFAAIAQQGFTTVINNRPDGEDAAQPGSAAEQQAAREAGLGYVHIPVTVETISEADIKGFQQSLAAGPVVAHCKSGLRSLTLWTLGEVLDGRMKPGAVISFGQNHGYDLKGAAAWLAHRAEKAPQ
jgi:uncharacterized protein (TIGR01244 family)